MNSTTKQSNLLTSQKCQEHLKYVLLVLIFVTFQQFSLAQNPNPSSSLDAEILNEMSTRNFPGASTIIVKSGEIVWVESYGYADIANSVPVEDTTVFLLASVSKLFAGTAVMQLHESEIIDLDADINNYLPWTVDVPNYANDSITARQLMTHTASINDNWGVMGSYYGYPDPVISLSNCMENYFPTAGSNYNASNNFLNTPPGSTYDYSNMGSALNGYLVEASTGVPFDDYCDNNIFNQLCMANTAWHFSDFNPNQVATPHNFQNGNYNAIDHYGFADYPNGQLRSTVMDIGNYMITFLNGGTFGDNSILSESSVNEMLSLQIPNINSVTGLNWYKTTLYHSGGEAKLWGHSGSEQGASTYLYIDPQNDIGICLLTNGNGDGLYICDDLYDHALNMTVNNSIIPDCIESFEHTRCQEISLPGGWFMFSSFIATENMNVELIMSSLGENLIIVKNNNGDVYLPEYGFNGLGDLIAGQGYQIKTNTSDAIEMCGLQMLPEENPIYLDAGWNTIAYLRESTAPTDLVMESLTNEDNLIIAKNYSGDAYLPSYNFNGIGNLIAGQGYQIKINDTDTLEYLSNNLEYRLSNLEVTQNNLLHFSNAVRTDNNMTIIIEEDAWETPPEMGSEIGVFNKNGILVGSSIYSSPVSVITVWGDDFTTDKIDGLNYMESLQFKIWDQYQESNFEVSKWKKGSDQYVKDEINIAVGINIINNFDQIKLFDTRPNPSRNITDISFFLPEKNTVNISVYNIVGKLVNELTNSEYDAGTHIIKMNVSDLDGGTYFYKMTCDKFSKTKQLVILR